MGLISLITKGISDLSFLTALVGKLAEGIITVTARDKKTRITLMKRLKASLEDQGYDLSGLTMKFRGFNKTVFMKADAFFERMNRYRVIFDLVAIYDEFGSEIDIEDITEAMMYEGIFGDDDEIDEWGDFGGWD